MEGKYNMLQNDSYYPKCSPPGAPLGSVTANSHCRARLWGLTVQEEGDERMNQPNCRTLDLQRASSPEMVFI